MKKSIINIVYSIICFALAVVIVVVMAKFGGVRIYINTEDGWTYADCSCIDVAFGQPQLFGYMTLFKASPLLCLELFLIIIGAFLALSTVFDNIITGKTRAICSVAAAVFLFFAGVLLFLNGQLYVKGGYFYQKKVIEQILAGDMKLGIGPGAIIAGALSFYLAFLSSVKSVLTFLKLL